MHNDPKKKKKKKKWQKKKLLNLLCILIESKGSFQHEKNNFFYTSFQKDSYIFLERSGLKITYFSFLPSSWLSKKSCPTPFWRSNLKLITERIIKPVQK